MEKLFLVKTYIWQLTLLRLGLRLKKKSAVEVWFSSVEVEIL